MPECTTVKAAPVPPSQTCRTFQRRQRRQILLYAAVVVLGLIVWVAAWTLAKPAAFHHPAFEREAVSGTPTVDAGKFGYTPLQVEEGYTVLLCAVPANDGQNIQLNLTNPADNTVWLRAEVLNQDGERLEETGVLKQGQYLQTLHLSQPLQERETPVSVHIIAYEPDRWTSRGNVTLNLTIYQGYS